MAEKRFLLVRGRPEVYNEIEDALRSVRPGEDAYIVVCDEGRLVFLRVVDIVEAPGRPGRTVERETGGARVEPVAAREPRPARGVAVVFDQMYKGFADIVARELPVVEAYEVLGRGIDRPVRRGRITLLPAEDDYDVMKRVLELAGKYDRVVFYTGDKRLARQVEAADRDNVTVVYLPPSEAPGKEALARRIVEEVRAFLPARN